MSYSYSAYGGLKSIGGSAASTVGVANSFRYKGYYLDDETGYFYCNTRYYVPEWCRWLNADSATFLNRTDFNGMNLFAYCKNDPVNFVDPTGTKWWKPSTWDWGLIADVAVTAVAAIAGVAVASSSSALVGIAAGAATFGAVNNAVNAAYYNSITEDPNNEIYKFEEAHKEARDKSYYVDNGYINRWNRLGFTKSSTKDGHYNLNAWRYYSEYNFHMYTYFGIDAAAENNNSFLSKKAKSAYHADVAPDKFESGDDAWRNIFYIAMGLLGL